MKFTAYYDNKNYKITIIKKGISVNGYNEFYCGRGTKLGNPFRMHSEDRRNVVCDEYEKVFHNQLKNNASYELEQMFDALLKYEEIKLSCYCAPKRCHTETIAKHLMEMLKEYYVDTM